MPDTAAVVICLSRQSVHSPEEPSQSLPQAGTSIERPVRAKPTKKKKNPSGAPRLVTLEAGEMRASARLVSLDVHEVRLDARVGCDPGQRIDLRIADSSGATLRLTGLVHACRRFGSRYRLRVSLQPNTSHAIMMRRLFLSLVQGAV